MCGPCWAAGDGDISTAELTEPAPAPVASELPRTAFEWFRAIQGATWLVRRRRDAAARMCGLLKELALRADWEDHTTWPTWDRLQTASGWRRSSTAAALAELQARGWLLRIESGTTPRFRPMALQHLEGNRAAVYQLRIPTDEAHSQGLPTRSAESSSPETWTPTPPPTHDLETSPVVRTRANTSINNSQVNAPNRTKDGPTGPRHDQRDLGYFADQAPVTPAAMLAAGLELQAADPALRRLGPRWIRSLLKPWWRAGWTNRDVLFALEHRPSTGGPAEPMLRCPAGQLRRPDGWVRHRLSAWQDESGPLVAPSVDARRRSDVHATQGGAAAARLPYGAAELRADDLHATEQDRAQAAEQLVRQWAREFHEHRARRRPDEDVATSDSARGHYEQITATLRGSASDAPQHPTGRDASPPASAPPATPDSAELDSTSHERALERARAERRSPAPRRSRRHRRFR